MRDLVLVGGGHAHAFVLEALAARPIANTRVTLIAPHRWAAYSGMVPGWLAGAYRFDEISLDVAALAARAGARFVAGDVVGLDSARRCFQVRQSMPTHDGAPLHGVPLDAPFDVPFDVPFDLASINVGSTLTAPATLGGTVLTMRPLDALHGAWSGLLRDASTHPAAKRVVHAAGGGAAATESVLAALHALRRLRPDVAFEGTVCTSSGRILATHAPGVQRAMLQRLQRAQVRVETGCDASRMVVHADDIVLWATGAQAWPWPRQSGLACDEDGFIRVTTTLQSASHPSVFAAGDCSAWPTRLPKAGVIAVRMGPVLAHNLRAQLTGQALQHHVPQSKHLALLATADGSAIASWGRWSAQGRWAWRWKDRIDRRFVARFGALQPPQ